MFLTGICPPLNAPLDGTIDCSLGDDGQPTVGDFCRFTCRDGFELDGSDMRICQNSSTWSGTESTCTIGLFIITFTTDYSGSSYTHPTVDCLDLL